MTYNDSQLKRAEKKYNEFLNRDFTFKNKMDESPQSLYELHKKVVESINNGNKNLEKRLKWFFLKEEVNMDRKIRMIIKESHYSITQ